MNEQEKIELLETAKKLFREDYAKNHLNNTKKLNKLKAFKINPFLHKYLTIFAFGEYTYENRAKALIYPRAFGTSLTTGFGTFIQKKVINELKQSYGSTNSGMDIEFIDAIDGRKKYCQLKAGPETVNKGDIKPIKDSFRGMINLARTNGIAISPMDCIVGVCYGNRSELNEHYKKIDEDYPVFVGDEFWTHLTGDEHFYEDLINAFAEIAIEFSASEVVEETVQRLAENIKQVEEKQNNMNQTNICL